MTHATRPFVRRLLVGEALAMLAGLLVFLVVIGNILVDVDAHLGRARSSATAVDGGTRTLPGLVDSLTDTLTALRGDVRPLEGDVEGMNRELAAIRGGVGSADRDLDHIGAAVAHAHGTLVVGADGAHRIDTGLLADRPAVGILLQELADVVSTIQTIDGAVTEIGRAATLLDAHLVSASGKVRGLCGLALNNLLSGCR